MIAKLFLGLENLAFVGDIDTFKKDIFYRYVKVICIGLSSGAAQRPLSNTEPFREALAYPQSPAATV
jgi:hypothetical protein